MNQSAFEGGIHAAVIMDGNGRWAANRGLPRTAGHRAGGQALRRVVEAAPELGIGILTVYAFSSDNWKRPSGEIRILMGLFREYLENERQECVEKGVRLSMIGRRDRLPAEIRRAMAGAEGATQGGRRLHLRIAVDYSARDAILQAARRIADLPNPTREDFGRWLAEFDPLAQPAPDVDLLIRTGGESRLSDFLLWESAYAELFFTATLWPDFTPGELASIVDAFRGRERRFGGLPTAVGGQS